jgi:hypothetical protein
VRDGEADAYESALALVEAIERVARSKRSIPLTGRVHLNFDDYTDLDEELAEECMHLDSVRQA